jgi:hypothetical protein
MGGENGDGGLKQQNIILERKNKKGKLRPHPPRAPTTRYIGNERDDYYNAYTRPPVAHAHWLKGKKKKKNPLRRESELLYIYLYAIWGRENIYNTNKIHKRTKGPILKETFKGY